MVNKLVIHYADGTIRKGVSNDFFPNKDRFHLTENGTDEVVDIVVEQLKGIFVVKSFEGKSGYKEAQGIERVGMGKRICVHFTDGETVTGYTSGYHPERTTFVVFPEDPESNNEKIFVVTAATDRVEFV